MIPVDVKVELGLNAFLYTGGNFILDSDSLGVLGVSKISGLAWYDVSEHVKNVQVRRGRSRQLEYFLASSATIVFNNADRVFDPLNENSFFYPSIEPRCLVRISSKSKWIFTGFVNDWDFEYDIANQDVAFAKCSEAFSILSNQLLTAFTPSVQKTGARINAVINRSEVGYRGGRNIANGLSELGAYAVDQDTNVLNYLRQIERSELGSFFVGADGALTFRERGQPPANDVLIFSDDGTGIPYQTLKNEFGDENLFNLIRVKSPAGAEQIISDADSITEYQTSQLSWNDMLNSTTDEIVNIARILLGAYKEPKVRFTGFSVQMVGLSEETKLDVLSAELMDYSFLKKSFAVGSPSSFEQLSVLTGINHSISPAGHRIEFTVENAEAYIFIVLGDSFAGRLDSGVLNF